MRLYPPQQYMRGCDGKPRQVFEHGGTVEIKCIMNHESERMPIFRCPSVIYLWSWDHIETFRQSGSGWIENSRGAWRCDRCVRILRQQQTLS